MSRIVGENLKMTFLNGRLHCPWEHGGIGTEEQVNAPVGVKSWRVLFFCNCWVEDTQQQEHLGQAASNLHQHGMTGPVSMLPASPNTRRRYYVCAYCQGCE